MFGRNFVAIDFTFSAGACVACPKIIAPRAENYLGAPVRTARGSRSAKGAPTRSISKCETAASRSDTVVRGLAPRVHGAIPKIAPQYSQKPKKKPLPRINPMASIRYLNQNQVAAHYWSITPKGPSRHVLQFSTRSMKEAITQGNTPSSSSLWGS